ncbi:hypothetical protein [Oceanicella sp. SM1341]|uniref:hypothetical protein n=1 Tax=Oceanicella sp. SM1341 TaxID=1548889 RepID=UPI000E4C8B11|nr:hypothetical protein [Oceanicella sp. SM1341]
MTPRRLLLAGASLSALVALLPILSVLAAAAIAGALGCRLDEGSAHDCVLLGANLGETLYAMGVAGWLALVSLPLGGLGLLVSGLLALLLAWRRRARAKRA